MLKKLLKNNCLKFRKELLGNICLGLNKVPHKFLSTYNCIFKSILFVLFLKKFMVSESICIQLCMIYYLSELPCSFTYTNGLFFKTAEDLFRPNSGDTQSIH